MVSEQMPTSLIQSRTLPCIEEIQKDPVANVRMNIAKAIKVIIPKLSEIDVQEKVTISKGNLLIDL